MHDKMISVLLILAGFFLGGFASEPIQAQTATIPTTLGWYQVPNSNMHAVCPPNNYNGSGYSFYNSCPNVMAAWNSGAFDTTNNRLLVWGGGHGDYAGNEVYGFSLDTLTWTRLSNPSTDFSGCGSGNTSYPDGQNRSIHTYGGQTFIGSSGKLFQIFAGADYSCADSSALFKDTWLWDSTNRWVRKTYTMSGSQALPSSSEGLEQARAAYDPNTGLVFLKTNSYVYSFNLTTQILTRLNATAQNTDIHNTMVVDTLHKRLVIAGVDVDAGANQIATIDVSPTSNYNRVFVTTTGGSPILSCNGPGLAYNPDSDRIVGWCGGDTVYSLDLTVAGCGTGSNPACVWTPITYSGGPGAAQANGTWGRFSYSPKSKVFLLANGVDTSIYTLRLTASSGGADATPPVISGIATPSITSSGATVNWTTNEISDSQVEYGTTTAYGSSTTLNASLVTSHSQALSGLSASTLYHYRVKSRDSSGNLATSGDNTFTTVTTTSGDADFQARCTAPGVVLCQGFDDSSGFQQNVNIYPATVSGAYPQMDTTTKRSGTGSIRIDVVAPASANSGKFDTAFSGTGFGANGDFYFQVATRISPEMLGNVLNWSTTGWTHWKNYSFYGGNTSCTGLSMVNGFTGRDDAGVIAGTCNCSFGGFYSPFTTCVSPSPPYQYQQGVYTCPQGYAPGDSRCLFWQANKWMTFYHHIHFGPYDAASDTFKGSVVEAWVSIDGAPLQQWMSLPNFDIAADANSTLNHLELYPYMTGKDSTNTNYPTGHVWFDELIVSRQPIAAPGGSAPPTNDITPPAPPQGLTAN